MIKQFVSMRKQLRFNKSDLKILTKLLFFVLFLFIEFNPAKSNLTYTSSPFQFVQEINTTNKQIAVIGDLQRTSVWELAIGRESNDEERILLINEIAKVNPAMVVLLGDLVFDGSDETEWRDFDNLISPLKKRRIPVFPVLGNHEYWGLNSTAYRNVSIRFPQFNKFHWYEEKTDSLALIFLDSNENELTDTEWFTQKKWFEKKLSDYDSDPAIKGIVVFLHHPPYTNSLVTGDELHVQKTFVPAFRKCKKSLALISGHAHTYERFFINNKTYIVSGGGGGPRVGLRDGIDFHKDLYTGSSPRPFHFLLLERDSTGLKVTVRALLKGTNLFYTLEEFYLKVNS